MAHNLHTALVVEESAHLSRLQKAACQNQKTSTQITAETVRCYEVYLLSEQVRARHVILPVGECGERRVRWRVIGVEELVLVSGGSSISAR